jgi:hypothetical protein
MTKVRFHGPVAGFSGAMGEMVFADNEEKNRTIAYMKKHRPPTQAQLDHRARFSEAAARAKALLENPAKRAFYEALAAEREVTAHIVAFTDFLVAPSFKPLNLTDYKGQVGDPIVIRAVDDIGLADVQVTLTANDGRQIETGKAVEAGFRTGIWTYTATAAVPLGSDIFIELVGYDHAGQRTQHTESPRVGEDL